jgi:hypothetical protein
MREPGEDEFLREREAEEVEIRPQWNDLMFGVRRSIRYHLHRRQFFDRFGTWTNFLVIVSGGTVVALASEDGVKKSIATVCVGAIIAILSSFDLVVGFSTKARDHHDLMKEFNELEMEMTREDQHPSRQGLIAFTNKRLAIEENEPPTLRVLDMYCHNELCLSMGYPKRELLKIGKMQRTFVSYFDIDPNSIETFGEEERRLAEEKEKKELADCKKRASA